MWLSPFVNMFLRAAVVLSVFQFHQSACASQPEFPSHFAFGAATSSYQVEGGWNEDGKGPSIWDRFCHTTPSYVRSNHTGDVAADSYHRYMDDVDIAAKIGLNFYRFSISWPRILPNGFNNKINEAGVKYYSDLIDALLAKGIEPFVTIYHWELPVAIQDLGGWTNPHIVKWFADYTRVVYSLYADRVKTWITINEAISVCDFNYNLGTFAPRILEREFAPYLCNKHTLLAHAAAYRIYDKEYRHLYKGRVSLANNVLGLQPATADDLELAELGRQHTMGRYTYPIYSKSGGWPPSIEKVMLEYSLKQGYNTSRLPAFSDEEKMFIRGTADFLGINYYTTNNIRPLKRGEDPGAWFLSGSRELDAALESPPDTRYGAVQMLGVYPKGLRTVLNWAKREYGDVDIMILENGYSTRGYDLNDVGRIDFIRDHLKQVLLAMNDGVNVIGYTVWSLIDNFEWLEGYNAMFGLYEVDFESPERTRTPRASAHFYGCVIRTHSLSECPPTRYIRNHQHHNGGATITRGLASTILALMLIMITNKYLLCEDSMV